MVELISQSAKRRGILQRVKPRPFALHEAYALTEGMRNDQDVGKQDRRIETKAANRLQRNLRRSFGIEAKIEKARRLLAQCPVLRKIPTGLPPL